MDCQLKCVETPIGLTQGGLFSMLQFCLAVCMLVLKPLKEKYPELYPKAIADDTHLPAVIHATEDIARLEVLTVVDCQLKCVETPIGLTQGGLFSMLQFCLAVCMLVLKPLKEKYPELYPKAIADDTHLPAVIHATEDIARLAEWCHLYVELSKSELNLSANPRKFKLLQHSKWEGTELDIAQHLHLFPAQMHEGELKRPKVTRGALKVNGVAIGFDKEARVEIIHAQVRAHELKLKILEALCFRARPGGVGGARHHACFACISLLDTHFWGCVFCDPF